MFIIRMIESARRQAKLNREREEKLSKIPQSRLKGIEALPVELWSQIIGLLLDPYVYRLRRQCSGLIGILELRLVCNAFDKEILRALHQRLTLSQVPYHSFLTHGIQKSLNLDTSLRDDLLASALYRETQRCSQDDAAHFMAYRIKNCVLVAQHLSSEHSMQAEQRLYKTFCTAASTSCYCWSYIFTLRHGNNTFVHGVDDIGDYQRKRDILLEVSLLVANGYQLKDVNRWMARLGRLGMLVGYREHLPAVKVPERHPPGVRVDVCSIGRLPLLLPEELMQLVEDGITMEEQRLDQEVDKEFEILERHVNI